MFEEVCKTLHKWEVRDIPMIPVSVNFAGATLRQEGLADKMLHLIEKHHVRCEYLEVEVSESSSDMNQEMLAETSSKIRKGNVRVILDHFGAKDSSFSILSLMEFDGLKLDKSVISNIVGNGRRRRLLSTYADSWERLFRQRAWKLRISLMYSGRSAVIMHREHCLINRSRLKRLK